MAEFKRMTERDECGNADVKGLDVLQHFYDLASDEAFYISNAINCLADYEDSGLSPEQVTDMANVQKWISVKDRLPTEDKEYLVATRYFYGGKKFFYDVVYYGYFKPIGGGKSRVGFYEYDPVWGNRELYPQYWMQIPKPPVDP